MVCKRLQKNTIPNTIGHINVADIAEIDKDKKLLTRGAVEKGRAGGGVPPWGRQSAARPVGARATACQIPIQNFKIQNIYCKFSLAEFLDLPRVPPGGLRIPPVDPKKRGLAVLKSIKILIIF